ncbi:hypothetical protein C5C18_11915 [Rathayibacter tritici]|uniref:hypothetical protein n=1 Tax=Rathayibacter tritici TaxID=33888 RepID=UPI000CE72034|nr:hypothetical protein [Rathayibacter tritici]PPF66149.1 hypothetical protein C5C21_09680 [Rathayibacter tritici]PPG05986.1 hypothetical protein C5C18_11915 [Rathayibacter tritici]
MSASRGLQVTGKHGIPTREEAEAVIREQLTVTPEGEVLAREPNFKKIARTAPGFTALAVDILAATTGVDGAEAYSHLSGVAHAATTHLLPRGIPTGENTAGLIQTYEWVSTATRYPLDAVRVTIDLVTGEWNRPGGDAEKWRQVCDRSFQRIGAALGE